MIIGEIQKDVPIKEQNRKTKDRSELRKKIDQMVSGDYLKIECETRREACRVINLVRQAYRGDVVISQSEKTISVWRK